MQATMTKMQDAQSVGLYKPTSIDERKAAADFLLIQASPIVIRWKDDRTETVRPAQLHKLQTQHPNWMTDF